MIAKALVGVITFAMLLAFGWYVIGHAALDHFVAAESALHQLPGLEATIASDRKAAVDSQAQCSALVQSALDKAVIVKSISAPRHVAAGQPRPVLRSSDLAPLFQ